MSPSPSTAVDRRSLLRRAGAAGVAGAAGLAVVGSAGSAEAATGSPTAATACHTAFGTWQVTVYDTAGNVLDQGVQAAFHQDGLLTGANGSGRTIIGSWTPTGAATFTFFAHEQLFDPATGKISGVAHLSHHATLSADGGTFTSQGVITGYTLTGQMIFQQAAAIAATRFTMS
ncbi:conserved hypothetical protein [Catenulispora acidiphila DSM 44928]|uniref:Uncharacterized protein n=1 Tax=Catenulispora acidiphila (strain DSM 44928 / JCM 14897 / NBRC 102108 / NRRL B-24433 / ID139908) TaxID=479433 RepID=C7QAG7_CATAD|nr:hypothetical protein [Catenulispora acidiphila]ACU72466.1 conserved hypothetical protein [Catenulispora acidiphila DSM 44928]